MQCFCGDSLSEPEECWGTVFYSTEGDWYDELCFGACDGGHTPCENIDDQSDPESRGPEPVQTCECGRG